MMKKLYAAALMMAVVLPVAAQDTYESARLLGSDLNGTARYVGMGGAMEALGADISTISTNPAAIGLFRHSTASVSFGFVSQQDVQKFDGKDKTVMSFDQAGFVYSARLNRASFVNFAFNYHKSRNFNQIISAANALSGCSQNDLTYYKADKGIYELDFNKQGEAIGYVGNDRSWAFSESDYLNANALLLDPEDMCFKAMYASAYNFDRAQRGWIANYDFNLSGNVNDRFYWGLTVGLKDVNYRGYSEYGESLLASGQSCGSAVYGDERKIKGTGLEVIAGIIVRPVEDSPFRIGVSVATPTWYDLTTNNETLLLNKTLLPNKTRYGSWDEGHSHTDYDFKLYTPWKFGLSVGHTIGTQVALGASYEYSDFSTASNRVNKGDRYWYGDYGYSPSYIDEPMKKNTEKSLKGVHTLKAGVEFKPVPEMAVRFGYNYVSSPYEKNGMRDMTIDSPGVSYSSTTDYVNWQDTHRITCGLGYKVSGVNIDLAYQYNTTNGDFHPFQPYAGNSGVKEVSNKRHQVLLTLGYTF
jgi:opacity protein-like surface antigen